MSHWVTLVAGCSDYSFLPPAERKTEMTLKFLCFNARRASFYKSVMNVAASQRWYRIGPWCNATWKHSASGEVSDHFTGKHFAVSLQGMINFKETSDCSRVNERMEKVGFFHVFSLSALNQDWKNAMKIYPLASQEICYYLLSYTLAALDSETLARHRYRASGVKELATHPSAPIGRSRVPAIRHVTDL